MYLPFIIPFLIGLQWAGYANALTNFDDWAHQRIALEDVSIHFRYAGSGPPVLLVHGNPQYSLTWRTIGPLLAENYTVIAVDNRGAGDSSLPPDGNYTVMASAEDLKGVLDFLNITSAYVLSHDMGAGIATALAVKYPELVRRLVVTEYLLPGFGFETARNPGSYWDLYANWQLAFFSITDAAEFFISGKERQMLEWYFYHGSYSGATSFSEDIVNRYTSSISKPGFLRAMLGPFGIGAVTETASFFQGTLGKKPLQMATLSMGGEASLGPFAKQLWGNVTSHLETDAVPKAGHWIADENPAWVAKRVHNFFSEDSTHPRSVDLSVLDDRVTLLNVGYLGTLRNVALAGSA
ncbi:Alpha/Beta hydrolase protein, partial [Trichoderma sp. SZMC 28015]